MPKKKTYQEVKDKFSKLGWTLISKDYKDNKQPLEALCPKGCLTNKTYNNISSGNISCRLCTNFVNSIKQTIPITEKEKILNKEGYFFVKNFRYPSKKMGMILKCPKNHTFTTTITDFKRGIRCKKCKGLWADLESTIKVINKFNWSYVEGKYLNSFTKLKVKCPKGHLNYKNRADFIGKKISVASIV